MTGRLPHQPALMPAMPLPPIPPLPIPPLPSPREPRRLQARHLLEDITPLAPGRSRSTPRAGPGRAAPLEPRRIAVVGNAPEAGRIGADVDRADWVIRFNNAQGFGGETGRRLTHLVLMNFGGQTREWLEDIRFHRRAPIRHAQGFLLPIDPGIEERRHPTPLPDKRKGGEHDWTPELRARLSPRGAPVWLFNDPLFFAAGAALKREGGREDGVPSSGFLALFWLLGRVSRPRRSIDVYGFGFAGWDGHDWAAERRWTERRAREGRLRLHPLRMS